MVHRGAREDSSSAAAAVGPRQGDLALRAEMFAEDALELRLSEGEGLRHGDGEQRKSLTLTLDIFWAQMFFPERNLEKK